MTFFKIEKVSVLKRKSLFKISRLIKMSITTSFAKFVYAEISSNKKKHNLISSKAISVNLISILN